MTSAAVRRLSLVPKALGECDDRELLRIVQAEPRGSRRREEACEALVKRYVGLVRACARRYKDSPEPEEELVQVGFIGLLKAINNFDPAAGDSLPAYALPCIKGEIKRHFRDKRWDVHVRRSAQELRLRARAARSELTQRLGRPPGTSELASHMEITADELLDAYRAEQAFQASSLNAPLPGADQGAVEDLLGFEDARLETTVAMQAVWTHLGELPEREQELLMMRYYGNMTQSAIGERLGISQMHVSRLQAHALGYLRDRLSATGR